MPDSFFAVAALRLVSGVVNALGSVVLNVGLMLWDIGLTLFNMVAPLKPAGSVVPAGFPGAGGLWPEYAPPGPGDSRCSCPGLNALANHRILPHSGRGISFRDLHAAVRSTYNFAPTFSFYVPNYIAGILGRSYWTDKFNLSDIDVHNGIEHDASLTREDTYLKHDQGQPSLPLIHELLACGTGPGGDLTAEDLSRIMGRRRADARRTNPQYSLSTFHKLFSSSNSAILLKMFGGSQKDLRTILLEERLPTGWQSSERHQMGLTMTAFQPIVMRIELGIKEEVDGSPHSRGGEKPKSS